MKNRLSHLGVPLSEEHKKRIGESQMGHTRSCGYVHSDESKKKVSESLKGRVFSEESKNKMSRAQLYNKKLVGKHHSEETRKKISESLAGKKRIPTVHHHVKYKEIRGVDEIVILTRSEHQKLHARLRKEGKCKVPVKELEKISSLANRRRRHEELIQTL